METIDIYADKRTLKGNGPARRLRSSGMIPAVVYGPGKEPSLLSVKQKDLELANKTGNIGQALIKLTIDGEDPRQVMIKELQTDVISRSMLHVDFYEVNMARKIRVNVPVVVTGKSKGIEAGGMLQIIRRELEVLCLPGAIPESVVLDVSDLDIGDSIHVEEIFLGDDVEIPADVNFTMITVLSPKGAAEEEEEEGEGVDEEGAEEGAEEEASPETEA
ncbi:MAG: 50S ribosomal protein L25/general stress protein Ctc [Deltaproteobacteria bacterium]|nr:50S ribosomal protein L25/general stress protein Ctc [Deltaproteobacteria bacterium]